MTRFGSSIVALLWVAAFGLGGCASALPGEPPSLAGMEEPLELFAEPDDEAERQALPLGSFTGCHVGESRDSLEAMLGEAEGVEVVELVENSPAEIAGLAVGDLLVEASIGDGQPRELRHPSQWRRIELDAEPGDSITVSFDRASRRTSTTIAVVPRVRSTMRGDVDRVREEDRVGVVLRTATEVESRAAGLGPGGGAVVVGLAKRSPWRVAGIQYGDLVVGIDGVEISAPSVVLERIRAAGDRMSVEYLRDDERRTVETPLTRRAQELRELFIPPLVDHEYSRGKSDTAILLGLFRWESTRAAWRMRLLWFFWFSGGDADELLEADS